MHQPCIYVFSSASDRSLNSAGPPGFFFYFPTVSFPIPPVFVCLWGRIIKSQNQPQFFAEVETFSTSTDVSLPHFVPPRWICVCSCPLKSFHRLCMQLYLIWNSPQVISEHTFMVSMFETFQEMCTRLQSSSVNIVKRDLAVTALHL